MYSFVFAPHVLFPFPAPRHSIPGFHPTHPFPASRAHRGAKRQLAAVRYENERLRAALATSSANAKKWEEELQTLRNTNTRLKTALQESGKNVIQWKKQVGREKNQGEERKGKERKTTT